MKKDSKITYDSVLCGVKPHPITKAVKSRYWKDCPECGLKGTYGQLITEQWYCWNCHHKGDS